MSTTTTRIAIADDHPVVRASIEIIVNDVPNFLHIGSACNSTELFQLLQDRLCDVLVTDYAMPGGEHGDGLAMLKDIQRKYPQLAIVILSGIDRPAIINALTSQGIRNIVSKADNLSHIVAAIHRAVVGRRYLSPSITAMTDDSGPTKSTADLSPREREVLSLYIGGATINQIASHLQVTKQTVSTQKKIGMRKLGIDKDADLFKHAIELRLTPQPLP